MSWLEEKIKNEKSDLDFRVPDPAIWAAIAEKLPDDQVKKKSASPRLGIAWRKWLVAASTIGFLFFSVSIIAKTNSKEAYIKEATEYHHDFEEVQTFYENKISSDMLQLEGSEVNTMETLLNLEILEKEYEDLKVALLEAPNFKKSKIVDALIENLNHRKEMLEITIEHKK